MASKNDSLFKPSGSFFFRKNSTTFSVAGSGYFSGGLGVGVGFGVALGFGVSLGVGVSLGFGISPGVGLSSGRGVVGVGVDCGVAEASGP